MLYNFRDYLINWLNFVRSRIEQLLIFKCLIIDVALYKQLFITAKVFDVIILCDMSNLLIFEQTDVNTPIFDMKQSSSSLQFDNITSIPFEGILIPLIN